MVALSNISAIDTWYLVPFSDTVGTMSNAATSHNSPVVDALERFMYRMLASSVCLASLNVTFGRHRQRVSQALCSFRGFHNLVMESGLDQIFKVMACFYNVWLKAVLCFGNKEEHLIEL